MTDGGPLDILACLRDNNGAEVPYSDLAKRSETHEIQGLFVGVASLKDIISAKETLPSISYLRTTSLKISPRTI